MRAARRGVQVELLTIGATDFPFVRWAGGAYYEPLLAAGARIHRLQEPKLHAKALVVDDEVCVAGSFDVSSWERRNTAEAAVLARDPALANAIGQGYRSCLARSQEIRLDEWRDRSRLRRGVDALSARLMQA